MPGRGSNPPVLGARAEDLELARGRHSADWTIIGGSRRYRHDQPATLTCRRAGRPAATLGLLRRGGGPGVAEGGDHLLREAVEVCELDVERGAERRRANDAVEAGIALLDRLQLLDDVLRPAGEEAAGLHRILDRRQFHGAGEPGVAHRRDLLVGQCPHEAQFAEHFHVLFVMRRGLADRLLAARRDVELVAERQPLAEFELDAAPGVSRLEAEHVPLDRAAFGRAAADHAADAVFRHELEGALGAALDRLPAFDRQPLRRRHQGDLLERVAAIRHLGRDRVVLALVRERLALERLEQDLDALLEHLAVGILVDERRAEGLDLTGVVAAPDAEDDPPAVRMSAIA